jgi:signal transduction histidine kinase
MPERYVLEELRDVIDYHNELDDDSSYGLSITRQSGEAMHFKPSDSPGDTSLAEQALSEFPVEMTLEELSVSDAGASLKTIYLWTLPLSEPDPIAILWCVSTNRSTWRPFPPLKFRHLGALCIAYLKSCYSKIDPIVLLAEAYEAGASRLALNITAHLAGADSAILWAYHPDADYLDARTIVGAAYGKYVIGIGKGIAGQISPTCRHVTVDLTDPDSPKPFHPDLIRSERWSRIQYGAVCSQGKLIGAIGIYWRSDNAGPFLPEATVEHIGRLAGILLTAEQTHLGAGRKLKTLEDLIVRLTPAQALVTFLHDVQRSMRDVTAGMTAASVLLDRSSSPERKSLAAQLSRSADFVDGCINRMARLALLQERVVNFKRTDVHLLLRNLVPILISNAAVQVIVEPGNKPVWIRADRLSLERAILNLVANAVYWTEQKLQGDRRVTVRLNSRDGAAVIDVDDTGIGIGPEVRSQIFEKFVTGRPESGSGMGLYIVRETVNAHGGHVEFFSNKHFGTTFRLTFPLMETA